MPHICSCVSEAGTNLISISTWSKADFLQATALEMVHVLNIYSVEEFACAEVIGHLQLFTDLGQLSATLVLYRPQHIVASPDN